MKWLSLAQSAAGGATGGDESALIWAVLLLGACVLLIMAELFVPSGGLIAVLAGLAALGSIILFFRYDQTWGFVALVSYLVMGPIAVTYGVRWWFNSPMGRRMILGGNEVADPFDPDTPTPMSPEHARQERQAQLRQLIGARGVAVTLLRPVGTVKIEGQRLDALAEAGIIEAGTPVIVTDVYDNQVKVRAAE